MKKYLKEWWIVYAIGIFSVEIISGEDGTRTHDLGN